MYRTVINTISLLLLFPLINFVFRFVEDIPSTEKKREISFNLLLESNLKEKFNIIEEAFERKFPARNLMIQKYNYFLWFVLNSSPKRTVLKGQNDWLFIFLGQGANGRDYSFNESDFLAYSHGIKKLENLCNSNNIKFYSAIVPEKFNIYPEELKATDLSTIKKDKYFRIFNELSKSANKTVFFHEELISRKHKDDVYYKTDTHWNSVAAFIAAQKLFSKMNGNDRKVDLLSEEDFNLVHMRSSGRDIAEYLSLSKFFLDDEYIFLPKQILDKRQKKLKILVIHDSYFYPMVEFFRFQFNEVDTWNFVQNEKSINYGELFNSKPDIVLFILLERHIGNYDKRVFGHL